MEEIVYEATVRVDDGPTITALDIGNDHIAHQRSLPHARLAEDGAMLASIGTEERCGASIFFFCAKEDIHEWAKLYTYNKLSTLWIAFLASGINSEAVGPKKETSEYAVIQDLGTF